MSMNDELLLAATKSGDFATLALALHAGALIDAKDYAGLTSAMYAATHANESCLTQLIAAGCNLEAKDNDGRTAAMLASDSGHAGCVAMIKVELDRRALNAALPHNALRLQKTSLRV